MKILTLEREAKEQKRSFETKKQDRRMAHTLRSALAYTVAAYNICLNWTDKVVFSLVGFVL